MTKIPTDLKMLGEIYDRYYADFVAYSDENKTRSSKIYVPIDIKELARSMSLDSDIVFGRLHHHLNEQFGYKNDDGSRVDFFAISVSGGHHCIHFPYLGSVLADLRDRNRKYLTATLIAILSLVIAILSIIISIFA